MPARVIFAVGLLLFPVKVFSQNAEADSLERMVKYASSDTSKVLLLNALVSALREKDNNKALTYAIEARTLADSLNYQKGQAVALENIGWILYRRGDYSKSLAVSTQALKLSEALDDRSAMARCQINIAAIYYEQGKHAETIKHLKKAYNTARLAGDTYTMARCYNNIAFTFFNDDQLDSAYFYIRTAFKLTEASEDPYLISFSHRTFGDIYLAKEKIREAHEHFEKCLALSVAHNITFIRVSVLYRLAKTSALLGAHQKALGYLDENVRIAKDFGFIDELETVYRTYSELYYEMNDLEKAYTYQLAYINLHDSLYNLRSNEQLTLMQTRFDTELKQAQIELLTKDAALQTEKISQQRAWLYFYAAGLILMLILAFVLFYNNRRNRKAKRLLEEKNKAIEMQTHQLWNLNATKDKLFSIISHDLRSPVASLKGLMEMLGRSAVTQEEFLSLTSNLKRNLDSVYDDLDNLLLWAQSQLKGLQAYPQAFDLFKVVEEKIELFSDIARNKNITITNTLAPGAFVFADRNHVSLIFRNLIANAIKFNLPGGSITISASDRRDYYEITVADSGIGISRDDIKKLFTAETHFSKPGTNKEKGAGIGLMLTKEFVETNQGSIWVHSQLGKGTAFTFTLTTAKQPVFA